LGTAGGAGKNPEDGPKQPVGGGFDAGIKVRGQNIKGKIQIGKLFLNKEEWAE